MSLDVRIDSEECNLCGYCVDACPVSIFSFDAAETRIIIGDLDACIVCRNCEDHCRRRCLVDDFPEWPRHSLVSRTVTQGGASADVLSKSRGS